MALSSREKFLTGVVVGAGGLIGLGIAVPVVGAAFAPPFKKREGDFVKVFHAPDKQDQAPDFATLKPFLMNEVVIGDAPAAAVELPGQSGEVGARALYVSVRNLNADYKKPVLKGNTFPSKDGMPDNFVVEGISNTCMHLGCPVSGGGGGFACPCHGGNYDGLGRRVGGPPVRPLDRYDMLDGKWVAGGEPGTLYAGQLHSVDNDFNRYGLTPPGVPLTGFLAPIYPAKG